MVYAVDAEQRGKDYGGDRLTAGRLPAQVRSSSGAPVVQISGNVNDFSDVWPTLADLDHLPGVRGFPFQCRDHLQVWQQTIGAACNIQPVFFYVSDESGTPLMMIPLGIRTRSGVRALTFLDQGVADYNAPVLYREAAGITDQAAVEIWEAICRAAPPFDVAVLEKMPFKVVDLPNPLARLACKPWPMSGHILRLGPTAMEEPLQSKHMEKENRRRRRRLAEIGPVSFNIATPDSDTRKVFKIFLRQKLQRYRETLGIDDFDVPGQRAYYHALTRRMLGRNVQLFWLAVGDDIVATAWCLCAGRQFYYMMCASERSERWRSFSPGRLLLEELVHWAGNNGFEVFDFGIGDEDYKLHWRQSSVPLLSVLEGRTAKGRAWCAALHVREELKQRTPRSLVNLAKRMLGKSG